MTYAVHFHFSGGQRVTVFSETEPAIRPAEGGRPSDIGKPSHERLELTLPPGEGFTLCAEPKAITWRPKEER